MRDEDFLYLTFVAGVLYTVTVSMLIAWSGYYILFLFLFILMIIYVIAALAAWYGTYKPRAPDTIPWNPLTDSDLEPYGPWELYPRKWEDDEFVPQ